MKPTSPSTPPSPWTSTSPSFAEARRAYRDLTAQPGEGQATRARVLFEARRWSHRPRLFRRMVIPAVLVWALAASALAAWSAGARWRAPARVSLAAAYDDAPAIVSLSLPRARPLRIIPAAPIVFAPSVAPDVPSAPGAATAPALASVDRWGAESRAYGRAHQVHFFADQPARALRAWDEYLLAFPEGQLVPEARYNRALCLVRLGRTTEAARALRGFARGARFAGYRQAEACLMLEALQDRAAGGDRGAPGVATVSACRAKDRTSP